jgi:ABC-type multidrug transport system fused ATPase/permease subunit
MLVQPEKWTLAVAIGALIVSTVCNLAQPYYFGKIISVCVDEGTTNRLNMYTEILVIINLIGMIASAIRGWLFTLVGERIVRDLRTNLFHEIALQDISFFDTNKTGELMNRLSSDTAVLQNALSVNISMGLRYS